MEDVSKILHKLLTKLKDHKCFMKIELQLQSSPEIIELLGDDKINSQRYCEKIKEEQLKEVE